VTTPTRCSDEIGVAGRLGGGLVASAGRAPIGLGFPAVVLGDFVFLAVDRRRAFFTVRFGALFRLVLAFLRAALPTVRFLRVGLALLLTFFFVFLVAIATSLPLAEIEIFVRSLRKERLSQRPSLSPFETKTRAFLRLLTLVLILLPILASPRLRTGSMR
jgi:hypothetical protein